MRKFFKDIILRLYPELKPDAEEEFTPLNAGPLRENKFDINATIDDIDPEVLESHIPLQSLSAISSKTGETLSANTINDMRKRHLIPNTFANPVQHLDYRIYESLLKHTFIGSLVDSFVKYLVGTGFKPELELINPDQDEEKNKKLIEKYQYIITDLLEIDRQIDANDTGDIDVSFADKITAMITSTLAYNRGALMFVYEKPIVVNGVSYKNIPNHMIFAHAQDLGIIETDQQSQRLKKVQWRMAANGHVPVKDMIYLWNPITSAKVHNSWFYGISLITPMISASKMIRQLLSNDFPAMAKNAWASPYLLVVKPEGNTRAQKIKEYKTVTSGLKNGAVNVLQADPENVELHSVNFEPKIGEFQSLFESMIKLCISIVGLPQVGFYDESAANRATMLGKIHLTMRTTIEPTRKWVGESIRTQHYQRWFELMYAKKEEPKIVRIKMSWNDINIEEWYDQVEAMLALDGRQQFKNREFGEIIGFDNYENMVDPDAEITPGGSGGMSMTDQGGNQLEMKKGKEGNKLSMKKGKGAQ